ncbi:MAG: UDP-2,3-diacylglucosamine diphosphatase [Gammaproteobacteria bacterium]
MTSLFISDLHLDEQRPDVADIFLNFLKTEARAAKELYILGDFFEAWIGDDDLSTFNQMIISALRKATEQGLPIYMMHGNRDFLLGKKFLQATGCQLLPEEAVINLHGVPTLLMHGDSLCTLDVKYLKFRKKSRTWLYKKLVSFKSLESRRAIAEKMRAASREHTKTTSEYIMDVTQTEVERVMQKHRVHHLIHGHTHREAVHHFHLGEKPATRTVLGPWHVLGSALICEANGKKELVVIK